MTMEATLQKRLIVSAGFIALTVAVIFWSPEAVFFAVVQAFSLLALNEFLGLAEKKQVKVNRVATLLFGALIPFSAYYEAELLVLAAAALIIFILYFDKRVNGQALIPIAVSLFGILYIPCFFSHLIKIRHLGYGSWLIFYTILLTKGGDAGAYFVGRKIGKTKLIEHVSPNKSVEGAVGGLVTTLVLSLISKSYLGFMPFSHLFVLGILIGVTAQLGDLAESLIKREAGVKDSGQIPGLGGFLDMLDSLIFTVPFVYYYIIFAL